MFGDRMLIANATGCSSIWGAAAGVTPYTTNEQGQGPAWSNSLLEDNAEFGYGMLLATQARRERLASKMTKAFSVASDSLRLLMEDWIAHLSESEGTQQRAAKLRAALLEEKTNQPLLESIYDDQDLFCQTKSVDDWWGRLGLRYWLRRD
ncbi:hypothetical protein EfsSVR2281_29110 [Enterococcus faecalis]|nr:hypothetical protein EfsSVR2281_29110 [Enterococcus faecalis]